jgi:hypothetical protein
MLKTSIVFVSMLLLAACHSLNNRHDSLAVQCDLNARTQDQVLVKFTNPGGVELTPEQVAQLQVQYQSASNGQRLTLTSRACVALPTGAARLTAKITGKTPLTAEIQLDEKAATDTIHSVALEAPGILDLGLKCPKNGWLAAQTLENAVEVNKAIGRLNGYAVNLGLYSSTNEEVRSLFKKDLHDDQLRLPQIFDLKAMAEGVYTVRLSVVDSYHDEKGVTTQSQCKLTVRRSCAKDEDFDPATVSCIPKLCDNAYRVGAKWTESLAQKRGEGRYECRLENGGAEKILLSHSCQGGYFQSSTSCLAAAEIAGNCARLETDEVVCWGTMLGKDNYPSQKDVDYQTTFKFGERIKKFGQQCVELESGKVHCWSLNTEEGARYEYLEGPGTPTTWDQAIASRRVDPGQFCLDPLATELDCHFKVVESNGERKFVPTPQLGNYAHCFVDAQGQVWCSIDALPNSQSSASSMQVGTFYKVEGLPAPARQVRSEGYTFCALLINGKVSCWGDNEAGGVGSNLSDKIVDKSSYVVDAKGRHLQDIIQLASLRDGFEHRTTLALTRDGRVFGWGSNLDGYLANGTPGEDDEGNALFTRFVVPVNAKLTNPILPQSTH